ncbi:hypothetical protein ASE73_09630 [Sphingomonas sp. Leaf24]|uniref:hypothetical protein n=1 Tax=unclassified Sphingomonas TaxID=196159 RepID=UPI0006F47ACB|nr:MULTISPECIES: hypothetical protein [unclassified Sphingomonas]KQM17231.1 hypothetical protein ASE50_07680 [Sphingomonas sp. Leaf5]KQM88123.1 hypothetical protein ASE73_09630 [Sphingomonas sp. Leaf24]
MFDLVTHARRVRLSVTADLCPQITLRILGLLAQRSIIPVTIAVTRRPRSLAMVVVFVPADAQQSAVLLAKIEALVGVRRARLAQA